ncbi:MAG: ATP-dependent Clp protease adapter ClpS [Acidimicrobiia bacterium]|nr:ATP-dependent Clp protease adapter ClpS [Acidimicrobiia bacterium]
MNGLNGPVPTIDEPGGPGGDVAVLDDPGLDDAALAHRPWVVIVWNDPINLMSYVTFVLQKLFGYGLEKATALMLDVHQKGKAVVASGTREQSEMHVFRLHEHGLWATLEHDE